MAPRHYAHFGRPLTSDHREAIRRALKERNARVRAALDLQRQLDTFGAVVTDQVTR
jgi:hypothetical protein